MKPQRWSVLVYRLAIVEHKLIVQPTEIGRVTAENYEAALLSAYAMVARRLAGCRYCSVEVRVYQKESPLRMFLHRVFRDYCAAQRLTT